MSTCEAFHGEHCMKCRRLLSLERAFQQVGPLTESERAEVRRLNDEGHTYLCQLHGYYRMQGRYLVVARVEIPVNQAGKDWVLSARMQGLGFGWQGVGLRHERDYVDYTEPVGVRRG